MEKLHRELESQWRQLVDDSQGPRHYCDSRVDHSRVSTTTYQSYGPAGQSIIRLACNRSILEMAVVEHTTGEMSVNRAGDLLVGAVLRGPHTTTTIALQIGGETICELDLYKDEPRLVLHGTNVIPLLCLPYQTIHIKTRGQVDLISGHLDNNTRVELARASWSLELDARSWLNIHGGCSCVTSDRRFTLLHNLPDHSWAHGLERQKARTSVFEEELVAAAWHPSRFLAWCVDMKDELR